MRSALTAAAIATSVAPVAEAQSRSVFGEARMSSSLHDRGEQLSAETLELLLGLEQSTAFGAVYTSIYRIEPIGPTAGAFASETDYSIGVIVEEDTFSADLSANWLTYPGSEDGSTLELALSIDIVGTLSPNLSAFYDAHTSDKGFEVSAGPSIEMGAWTTNLRGRAGMASIGDGSPNRSYAGIEVSSSRAVADNWEFGVHASIDAANRETFSASIRQGEIVSLEHQGVSAGISLSYTN